MNISKLYSNNDFMHSLRMMFRRKKLSTDDGVQETFAVIIAEEPSCIEDCLQIGNKVASRMWRRRKRDSKYISSVDVERIIDRRNI